MKALIKIVTANKEFTSDQIQIMRRVSLVLKEHNLAVAVIIKKKKTKQLKLKAI